MTPMLFMRNPYMVLLVKNMQAKSIYNTTTEKQKNIYDIILSYNLKIYLLSIIYQEFIYGTTS